MTNNCEKYEFYSTVGDSCVHCEPFCRLYPLECSETPECRAYISDYESSRVPAWAIALIVISILVVFALGIGVLLKFCPCDFLDRIDCMFSFKKKYKKRSERDEKDTMNLPYQQSKSKWSPVEATPYDLNAIRQRSVMDRFFASLEQHPPRMGVEELEPLNNTDDENQKRKGSKTSEDSVSENGTNASDLNTAMTMNVQLQSTRPAPRPSLDNRAIIENYHIDRVTRQGSFRINNTVENHQVPQRSKPKPEIHSDRPVQKGRRTGLKNLLYPRGPRPGASETTV